jgi:excisionase family DNA binding protein
MQFNVGDDVMVYAPPRPERGTIMGMEGAGAYVVRFEGIGRFEYSAEQIRPIQKGADMDELTTDEAADELGVLPVTVRALIQRGRLEAERKGRDYWIRRDELEAYKLRRRRPGRPSRQLAQG